MKHPEFEQEDEKIGREFHDTSLPSFPASSEFLEKARISTGRIKRPSP